MSLLDSASAANHEFVCVGGAALVAKTLDDETRGSLARKSSKAAGKTHGAIDGRLQGRLVMLESE